MRLGRDDWDEQPEDFRVQCVSHRYNYSFILDQFSKYGTKACEPSHVEMFIFEIGTEITKRITEPSKKWRRRSQIGLH